MALRGVRSRVILVLNKTRAGTAVKMRIMLVALGDKGGMVEGWERGRGVR